MTDFRLSDQPRCWVEIDAQAIQHNLHRVRDLVPNSQVMAVIKSNGYGHGMVLAARQLNLADEFAVTSIEDVKKLHAQNIHKPLTLLSSTFNSDDLDYFANHRISPVIYDYEQLDAVCQAEKDGSLDIWVKVDTGMGRLGFAVEEVVSVCARLVKSSRVGHISMMTHLANADVPTDERNQRQLSLFREVLQALDDNNIAIKRASILNSAGVVGMSDAAFNIVRPGIMLYGISPIPGTSAEALGLHAVMDFKASVISVRRMPAGSNIGYGGSYTLDADSRIAYIAAGYGDGYPRHAKTGTTVCVNGYLVPLVGRVSMDMIAVDIGELPVAVGDLAVLWGKDNPIEQVAADAGTIAYELTCGITERVARKAL